MISRRGFMGAGAAFFAMAGSAAAAGKKDEMQGFGERFAGKLSDVKWTPFSDRKVRCAIAGDRKSTRLNSSHC